MRRDSCLSRDLSRSLLSKRLPLSPRLVLSRSRPGEPPRFSPKESITFQRRRRIHLQRRTNDLNMNEKSFKLSIAITIAVKVSASESPQLIATANSRENTCKSWQCKHGGFIQRKFLETSLQFTPPRCNPCLITEDVTLLYD